MRRRRDPRVPLTRTSLAAYLAIAFLLGLTVSFAVIMLQGAGLIGQVRMAKSAAASAEARAKSRDAALEESRRRIQSLESLVGTGPAAPKTD